MPYVRRAKENIICWSRGLGRRALVPDEIVVPEIAHGGGHPAETNSVAVIRERIVEIGGIDIDGQTPLFAVARTKGFGGLGLCLAQCWKEHSRKDRYDGN